MSTENNLPQTARNGQKSSLNAAAFAEAFNPQPNINANTTKAWAAEATRAIAVLVEFRSAVHRWQALGAVPDAEFVAALELLDSIGLSGWLDELIALALRQSQDATMGGQDER